jgi:hypothetical protein
LTLACSTDVNAIDCILAALPNEAILGKRCNQMLAVIDMGRSYPDGLALLYANEKSGWESLYRTDFRFSVRIHFEFCPPGAQEYVIFWGRQTFHHYIIVRLIAMIRLG